MSGAEVHMRSSARVLVFLYLQLAFLMLTACPGGGSGSSSPAATSVSTWPPRSNSELLTYLDGKSFKSTTTDDTVGFSAGTLSFNGPTSSFHTATIFTSNTSSYQTPYSCVYTANELTTSNFNEYLMSLRFNILTSNDFEPGGIDHCVRPNCASCDRLEYVNFSFQATNDCFSYDGQTFCKQ